MFGGKTTTGQQHPLRQHEALLACASCKVTAGLEQQDQLLVPRGSSLPTTRAGLLDCKKRC